MTGQPALELGRRAEETQGDGVLEVGDNVVFDALEHRVCVVTAPGCGDGVDRKLGERVGVELGETRDGVGVCLGDGLGGVPALERFEELEGREQTRLARKRVERELARQVEVGVVEAAVLRGLGLLDAEVDVAQLAGGIESRHAPQRSMALAVVVETDELVACEESVTHRRVVGAGVGAGRGERVGRLVGLRRVLHGKSPIFRNVGNSGQKQGSWTPQIAV